MSSTLSGGVAISGWSSWSWTKPSRSDITDAACTSGLSQPIDAAMSEPFTALGGQHRHRGIANDGSVGWTQRGHSSTMTRISAASSNDRRTPRSGAAAIDITHLTYRHHLWSSHEGLRLISFSRAGDQLGSPSRSMTWARIPSTRSCERSDAQDIRYSWRRPCSRLSSPAARCIASSVTATAMGERLAITVAASLADLVVAARER